MKVKKPPFYLGPSRALCLQTLDTVGIKGTASSRVKELPLYFKYESKEAVSLYLGPSRALCLAG
jgi:hypothetical protein